MWQIILTAVQGAAAFREVRNPERLLSSDMRGRTCADGLLAGRRKAYTFGMNVIRGKAHWLALYRETMEELERIRARELHAMTEEEALRRIMSLGTCEPPWRERPDWSGLVEQQALFHRRSK